MAPKPTLLRYPELFKVNVQPGDFNSGLICLKPFKAGDTITHLTGTTKAKKSWSTVQHGVGPDDHIELNSVLVYVNHSCSPNAAFDLSSSKKSEWKFRALRDVQAGDELSFFYPSTEWEMDQGFQCKCESANCLNYIDGAKNLTRAQLEERGFISTHISQMLDQRERENA
ncbi:SET domain protein [Ceratobasidium sp. AG-Ba]|nr:SET domain protein [Ceratobasidium sp. AG-Ba]